MNSPNPDKVTERPSRRGFRTIALAGVAGLLLAGPVRAAIYEYVTVLTGSQETPGNSSTALGGGNVVIDTDANTLTFRIAYTGLSSNETAAHIHGPADPGQSGGVLTGLAAGSPKTGVWNYADNQEADILAGRTYFNIHTTNFPSGEVRGQIVSHVALLDGGQETPGNNSAGSGFALCVIDKALNQLKYHVAYSNLGSAETAAHIHGPALHGTSSGVMTTLPAGSPKTGVWNYTDAQEDAIIQGRTYVNVHTTGFPGGEIRGQLVSIVVPIDGGQEVPATGSPAAGIALIAYDTVTDDLSYDIRFAGLSSAETAAHIHGWTPAGLNGGVLTALPAGARKLGVWNYGAGNQVNLFNDLAYINIHSTNFPGGEIRGQLVGGWSVPVADVADGSPAEGSGLVLSAPNPFRDVTRIEFRLDAPSAVELSIYDTQGRLVRSLANSNFTAGTHQAQWDGTDAAGHRVASGTYRTVLRSESGQQSGKITVVR